MTSSYLGCVAEWRIHYPIALSNSVDPTLLEPLLLHFGNWPSDLLDRLSSESPFLSSILKITYNALVNKGKFEDPEYKECVNVVGEKVLQDILSIVGYYTYVGLTLNCFRVSGK